jgi:hypothetical protein
MTISYQITGQPTVGISRKNIIVVLRNDTPAIAYRRLEVPLVPIDADANTYLQAHYTLQTAWDAAAAVTAAEAQELIDKEGAAGNQLESRTLADALAYIDTATTVAALKLVLKEIVKELYLMRRVMEAYIRNH